jgi:hypothetical protein
MDSSTIIKEIDSDGSARFRVWCMIGWIYFLDVKTSMRREFKRLGINFMPLAADPKVHTATVYGNVDSLLGGGDFR